MSDDSPPPPLLCFFNFLTNDARRGFFLYMWEIALDGLVGLSKTGVIEDRGMIQGCYSRAVQLLQDMEDYVRSVAVRMVRYLMIPKLN